MKRTDPQFKLRIPQDLKERLERVADQEGRSVTAEIVHRLGMSFVEAPFDLPPDIAGVILMAADRKGISVNDEILARLRETVVNQYATIQASHLKEWEERLRLIEANITTRLEDAGLLKKPKR